MTKTSLNAGRSRIGVFRTAFPLTSETFIREQVNAMTAVEPQMVVRDLHSATHHVIHSPTYWWQKKIWTITRAPNMFPLRAMTPLRLLHAHFGPDAVMSLPLAETLGIPLVTTFHGGDITTDVARFKKSKRPTERWFAAKEDELQRKGAAFIAVSKFIETILHRRGYEKQKVHQLYIGIDTERFSPAPSMGGDRYLLCIGRHSEKKGLDTLITAWAQVAHRHPDVMLWQVGGGAMTNELKDLAVSLGVENRIRFMGALDHAHILGLMQQAIAFILPSQTAKDGDSEGLGMVFNEASACGIPIISTLHGGIPEGVLHGETGLLSPEKDIGALAAHMEAILGDAALAKRLGKTGREFVCDAFDIRKQTAKLEQLYAELM
jgi:colanic acid/amylovoran biosynthesis glycosyltransferase